MSTPLRTRGTRSSALWGKNGGKRARALLLTLAVCAGLALASSPIASAKQAPQQPTASWAAAPDASWA